ncbi:MAG: TetR/AcrR family transcriptional regulator [Myxococcota bacterium]|nr:TetR/AcrR family transcriptional regulator [Myxococcota bacterium]
MKAPISLNPTTNRGKHGQRREHILWMATQIIGEQGLEGLTMPALAKALNISAAALYKHFVSKNEILAILAIRVVQELDQVLARAFQASGANSWETLAAVAAAYGELYGAASGRAALMNSFITAPRKLVAEPTRGEVWTVMERWWGRTEDIVEALGVSPLKSRRVAWVVWTNLHGSLSATGFVNEREIDDVLELTLDSVRWCVQGAGANWDSSIKRLWHNGIAHGLREAQRFLLERKGGMVTVTDTVIFP